VGAVSSQTKQQSPNLLTVKHTEFCQIRMLVKKLGHFCQDSGFARHDFSLRRYLVEEQQNYLSEKLNWISNDILPKFS
jgi:hypothetical protein